VQCKEVNRKVNIINETGNFFGGEIGPVRCLRPAGIRYILA
jgi:hypothetical protein